MVLLAETERSKESSKALIAYSADSEGSVEFPDVPFETPCDRVEADSPLVYRPKIDSSLWTTWVRIWVVIWFAATFFSVTARPPSISAFTSFMSIHLLLLGIFIKFSVVFALNFPRKLQMSREGLTLVYLMRPYRSVLRPPFMLEVGTGVSGCGFFSRMGRRRGLFSILASRGILTSNKVPSVFVDGGGWRNSIVFTPQDCEVFLRDYHQTFASYFTDTERSQEFVTEMTDMA